MTHRDKKKLIAVAYPLGRTGSSALMGLLQLAGVFVGNRDRLSGPAPMNPKGFFEFPSQETFLQQVYAVIYPHISFPPPTELLESVGQEYAPRYRELLAQELGQDSPAAVKSQWFLTLPFLHRLTDEFDVRVLVMERKVHDQVSSLLRVYRETDRPVLQNAGRKFITRYVEAWRRFGKQVQEVYPFDFFPVSFDRLMRDPIPVTRDICRFIGVSCPPDSAVQDWIDPALVNRKTLSLSTQVASPAVPGHTPEPEPDSRPLLSVVINTLNEEKNLEDCLKSVAGVADEIVVVDMHSDDRTVEIARRFTDRVFYHDRTGVVEPAREFAIAQAAGDWIFIIDADERATPELVQGIKDVIDNPRGIDIFRIPRRNFVAGRWMAGTGLGMDVERQPRLFRRGAVSWPDHIHASPVMQGREGLLPLPLEARIDHWAYDDLHDFVDRLNRYTDHESRVLERNGTDWSLGSMLAAALTEAVDRYDPEADGVHSLVLALSMAYYRFMAWAKRWEAQGYPQEPLPANPAELAKLILDPSNRGIQWVDFQESKQDTRAQRNAESKTRRAGRGPAHGAQPSRVRLGLVIADSAPPETRYSSDSPLAFGYFVSYLREHRPECEVVFRHSIDELLAEGVDIVGISASTERFELARKMAARVKERNGTPVIIGGVHITVLPNNLTADMDMAVLGEGEVTLAELLECFVQRGGQFVHEDLRRVRGIAYRQDGEIHRTPPRPPIRYLDSLPIPDRKALDIGLPGDRAFLFTSRGCPYRCAFCASSRFWRNLRYFSAEYVVREIVQIHRDLGIHDIHFFDDLFITPISRLRSLCRLIEQKGLNREINFTGAVHAHLVDRDLCETLNRMNVTEVMFGAESFSPRVLDYLKCGKATPEDNQRAIDLLNEYGIRPNLSMIYGAPAETREDLEITLRTLEENLQAGKVGRWQYCRLRLYPGTPVWDEALQRGLVSEDMNWDEIEHPPPHHYMGGTPKEEFDSLLQEHKERSIAIAPDNVQMWQEWGLTPGEVAEVLVARRPDLMEPCLDFSRSHAAAQLGEGWYPAEGEEGNRFRWMGRKSVTYLRGNPEAASVEVRGIALLDKLKEDTLTLKVSLNGEFLGLVPVEESPFHLCLEIPEPFRTESLLELTLTASRTFRAPPDVRDLSVIVSAIGLVSQAVAAVRHMPALAGA